MKSEYITPSVTLFTEDGKPDFENLEKHYNRLIENGISGILVLGSIGEFFAISKEDKKAIIRFAVDAIKGKTKVLIGTGSMVEGDMPELTEYAFNCGADGVVVISPYYFKLTDDSLMDYYGEAANAAGGRDVYIYNFPDRTGYDISPELMLKLARKYPNIAGCKDTIPGIAHTRDVIKTVKSEFPDFKVYSGFDDNFAYNILSGGNGCIGGLSNIIPQFFKAWREDLAANDLQKSAEKQQMINRLMDIYNVGVPFVPFIKSAMKASGLIDCDRATFPLPKASAAQTEAILKILNSCGF